MNSRPNAIFVPQRLAEWFEDCNAIHLRSGLRMRSPRELIAAQKAREMGLGAKNARTVLLWTSSLEQHAYPTLGDVPVAEINRAKVREAIDGVWTSAPSIGRKVLRRIAIVLRYAAAHGWRASIAVRSLPPPFQRALGAPRRPLADAVQRKLCVFRWQRWQRWQQPQKSAASDRCHRRFRWWQRWQRLSGTMWSPGAGTRLRSCQHGSGGHAMRLAIAAAALIAGTFIGQADAAPERRCGWLANPSPANWWLLDRDGEWVLSVQGREPVPGLDTIPDMTTLGWVGTNGPHGYGCACLVLDTAPGRRVVRILSGEPLPTQRCNADRALPPPPR